MPRIHLYEKKGQCRVCGTTWRVAVGANANSPYGGCCVQCGTAARALLEWAKGNSYSDFGRLLQVVQDKMSAHEAPAWHTAIAD